MKEMNVQEAIEILDKVSNDIKESTKLGQAFEIALVNLEKKIPKKPRFRHTKKFDGYNDGWCPFCGDYVQEYEYDKKYCQECGQALDWSENENT